MNQKRPQLQRCPACRKDSLFWNGTTSQYECLNGGCDVRYSRDKLARVRREKSWVGRNLNVLLAVIGAAAIVAMAVVVWVRWLSPWIHSGWTALVFVLVLAWAIANWKYILWGAGVAGLVLVVALIYTSNTPREIPWTGPDGEKLVEIVRSGPKSIIVGADGNPIMLLNNKASTDPTWAELTAFLREDRTDQRAYDYASFVCADFAEVLHNNAEAQGIRAAYVSLDFVAGKGHALNAFRTTDRGIVYIDDTNSLEGPGADTIIALAVGKPYVPQAIFATGQKWQDMGTVKGFTLTW